MQTRSLGDAMESGARRLVNPSVCRRPPIGGLGAPSEPGSSCHSGPQYAAMRARAFSSQTLSFISHWRWCEPAECKSTGNQRLQAGGR